MNKEKLLSIFTLPFLWFAYFLFELFTGRVSNVNIVIGNISLMFLFAIIGFLFYNFSMKFPNGLNKKKVIILSTLFITIDQTIKLLIKVFVFNKDICLITKFLYFNPIINTQGSWLNARFNTGINFTILIIFNFLALFLFIEVYRFMLSKSQKNFWMDFAFIFIFSGALCSLIDKIFYGGSLDFIGIGDLFIADIKDIYINLGLLFFIVYIYVGGYFSSDDKTSITDDIKGIKKFVSFIIKDIKSLFH